MDGFRLNNFIFDDLLVVKSLNYKYPIEQLITYKIHFPQTPCECNVRNFETQIRPPLQEALKKSFGMLGEKFPVYASSTRQPTAFTSRCTRR